MRLDCQRGVAQVLKAGIIGTVKIGKDDIAIRDKGDLSSTGRPRRGMIGCW